MNAQQCFEFGWLVSWSENPVWSDEESKVWVYSLEIAFCAHSFEEGMESLKNVMQQLW